MNESIKVNKIKVRLCEMLEERGIRYECVGHINDPKTWAIFVYDQKDPEEYTFISPNSRICEQTWMEKPIMTKVWGEPVLGSATLTDFDEWKKDLDLLFDIEFGMGSDNFEDYDWKGEWEGENTPGESFDEWKLLTNGGAASL